MKKRILNKFGFSLVEVILAVFLMGLIFAIGFVASGGRIFISDILRTQTDELVSFLRNAQLSAMYGNGNSDYTVTFEENRVSAAPGGDFFNFDGVKITNIDISDGGSSIKFLRNLGTANPFGSVMLKGGGGSAKTVTVSSGGLINWTMP